MRVMIATVLGCGLAWAQTPDAKLTFEVASIKPAPPLTAETVRFAGNSGGPGTSSPGQITYGRMSLKALIVQGFGVRNVQVSGPAWLDSPTEFWEIHAKVPPGATKDDVKAMIQNLLVERFGLVAHRETKELPAYELTIAKSGLKMKESVEDATPPPPPPQPGDAPIKLATDKNGLPQLPAGRPGALMGITPNGAIISARQQTVAQLANMLENELRKPVVDKTGLTGKYDFSFQFASSRIMEPPPRNAAGPVATGQGPAGPGGPSVPALGAIDSGTPMQTAVQQELGLKLEQKKLPVDVVVVDHLEKSPTEN
jgi:uncharacterized protein (TIGR03435 family)